MDSFKLLNGYEFPMIGFGTWQLKGKELTSAIDKAIESGYKNIDTAYIYGNEQEIGDHLLKSGTDVDFIIITTKVWNSDQGYKEAIASFERSEKALGKVDLLLIHWPGFTKYKDTWKAFEELYEAGRLKAIGLSNFRRHHLESLFESAKIKPMVNQIETNPYMYDKETVDFCKNEGILVQAWSPLAHGGEIFKDERLLDIARSHNKSVSQVVLNYLVKDGLCVLPKSKTPKYIEENIDIFGFELSPQEKEVIASMNVHRRCGPDPDTFFSEN